MEKERSDNMRKKTTQKITKTKDKNVGKVYKGKAFEKLQQKRREEREKNRYKASPRVVSPW